MEIAVVRTGERLNKAVVVRPDGTTDSFVVHDYGEALPHDLAHYVVESELGLAWGFWGLVAAGAQMQALVAFGARDKRAIGRTEDPLITAHLAELTEAERLVNALHSPWSEDGVSGVDPEAQARIRGAIDDLNRRWQATPVGESLRLEWPMSFSRG